MKTISEALPLVSKIAQFEKELLKALKIKDEQGEWLVEEYFLGDITSIRAICTFYFLQGFSVEQAVEDIKTKELTLKQEEK